MCSPTKNIGSKNIIVAGGLGYAYDLSGTVGQAEGDPTIYALIGQGSNNDLLKAGNGIIYDTHIYPWKGRTADWDVVVEAARKKYPILVGENGWDAATIQELSSKTYYPGDPMYHDKWVNILKVSFPLEFLC